MEEDDLEWEEWNPSKISFLNHMLAGSTAGLAEHVSVFPIDTLKTHIQCERCGAMSPLQTWNCASRIVGREGIFRLWRGVSATFAGCLPAHAAYFSIFESTKVLYGAHKEGHHPIQAAACGASAAIGHDMCMTPFDTVKQRMQLGHYKNVSNCVSTIVKREGIKAFYLSLPTTLMMNIPYGCIMVAVNESAVKVLNPKGDYSFGSTMTAGSIAGAIAAALTNPLDVIKTRLQTQNLEPCTSQSQIAITKVTRTKVPFEASCIASPVNKGIIDSNHSPKVGNSSSLGFNILKSSSILNTSSTSTQIISDSIVRTYTSTSINSVGSTDKTNIDPEGKIKVTYKSALDCARHIFREEGYKGFLRGLTPRMLQHAPAVAISWTTYETMKKLLST